MTFMEFHLWRVTAMASKKHPDKWKAYAVMLARQPDILEESRRIYNQEYERSSNAETPTDA